jgi:hypothetical protein
MIDSKLLLSYGKRLHGQKQSEGTGSVDISFLLVLLLVRLFKITLCRNAGMKVLSSKTQAASTLVFYTKLHAVDESLFSL